MPDLGDELITAIKDQIPDLTLTVDRSKSGRYVILKRRGKTIGYINGKLKYRIDSPRLDRKILITNPAQIPVAIEFLESYLPEEAAT
jgi:hypothetical protein